MRSKLHEIGDFNDERVSTSETIRGAQNTRVCRSRLGYPAYGEDILAISWFQHFALDLTAVRYLDIGAAHPWEINNTLAFYLLGAKGVLVEPDPDQAKRLVECRLCRQVIEELAAGPAPANRQTDRSAFHANQRYHREALW